MARHGRGVTPPPPPIGGYEFEVIRIVAGSHESPQAVAKAAGVLIPVCDFEPVESVTPPTDNAPPS